VGAALRRIQRRRGRKRMKDPFRPRFPGVDLSRVPFLHGTLRSENDIGPHFRRSQQKRPRQKVRSAEGRVEHARQRAGGRWLHAGIVAGRVHRVSFCKGRAKVEAFLRASGVRARLPPGQRNLGVFGRTVRRALRLRMARDSGHWFRSFGNENCGVRRDG